jgi:hypothetical protein
MLAPLAVVPLILLGRNIHADSKGALAKICGTLTCMALSFSLLAFVVIPFAVRVIYP